MHDFRQRALSKSIHFSFLLKLDVNVRVRELLSSKKDHIGEIPKAQDIGRLSWMTHFKYHGFKRTDTIWESRAMPRHQNGHGEQEQVIKLRFSCRKVDELYTPPHVTEGVGGGC